MSFAESNGVHHHHHTPVQNLGSSDEPYYPIMPPMTSSEMAMTSRPAGYQVHVSDAGVPVPIENPVIAPAIAVGLEPVKRKRGRPRRYDGGPGMTSPQPLSAVIPAATGGGGAEGAKKARGRPLGSGRKQQLADLGPAGGGSAIRPHVIILKPGEDVLAKVLSFSQSTSQAVCILSASGSISNVALKQATVSGGTVTYEGHFEILCLSGCFLLSETGGERNRTGGLNVLLAGADGQVLGGGVAGLLTAASGVQVIVGSFDMEGQQQLRGEHSDAFAAPSTIVSGASPAAKSPSSLGTVSEASGEPVSPHNQLAETPNHSTPVVSNDMPWR